jgi:hypothetical protein
MPAPIWLSDPQCRAAGPSTQTPMPKPSPFVTCVTRRRSSGVFEAAGHDSQIGCELRVRRVHVVRPEDRRRTVARKRAGGSNEGKSSGYWATCGQSRSWRRGPGHPERRPANACAAVAPSATTTRGWNCRTRRRATAGAGGEDDLCRAPVEVTSAARVSGGAQFVDGGAVRHIRLGSHARPVPQGDRVIPRE